MEDNEIIRKYFKEDFESNYVVSEEVKKKLIKLWTMRACRFFVESQLDTPTIEEDLEKGNLQHGLEFEEKKVKEY